MSSQSYDSHDSIFQTSSAPFLIKWMETYDQKEGLLVLCVSNKTLEAYRSVPIQPHVFKIKLD